MNEPSVGIHTVIVVEDDPHARSRIVRAASAHPSLSVVGESGSVKDGLVLLRTEAPDVLLVDLGLPDGSGLELIRAARRLAADTQTMVITVFGDEPSVIAAIEAGARGYLLKDGSWEYIGESIMQLLASGSPISPPIARHLLKRFQRPKPAVAAAADAPALTERENDVLLLTMKGFTFDEIAGRLGLSPHTVRTHVRHIYRKLEVSSRGEAVFEAASLGLIRLTD